MIQNISFWKNTNNIITDGLVFHLDANSYASYTGTGTTWYDLTTNNYDGTLTNGPTYSFSGGGSIDFDGVDDYVQFPIPSTAVSSITMMGFVNVTLNRNGAFYRNGNASNGYAIGIGSNSNFFNGYIWEQFDHPGNYIAALFPGRTWLYSSVEYDAGWQMVTFILNSSSVARAYKNLTEVTLTIPAFVGSSFRTPITPTNYFYLGRVVGDEPVGATRAADCNIANFMFYNRELSANEIATNYYALKGNFGL